MAKVMISLPDELLARIDAHVESEHATRSGFLRALAERELSADDRRRGSLVAELLDAASGNFGGDAAALVREDRESR